MSLKSARAVPRAVRRGPSRLTAAVSAVVVVALVSVVVALTPWGARLRRYVPFAGCTANTVQLVVSPSAHEAVSAAVSSLQGAEVGDGTCLKVQVTAQDPAETTAESTVLPASRAPQVWVPDSTLWSRYETRWSLRSAGVVATSPLVLATSRAVADRNGWLTDPPTWTEALDGTYPVAAFDGGDMAVTLTLLAMWGDDLDDATARHDLREAVLTGSGGGDVEVAFERGRAGAPDAPLVLTSEQQVIARRAASTSSDLVAVYPQGASPALRFPVYRVAPEAYGEATAAAVDLVVGRLVSAKALQVLRDQGLRSPSGRTPDAAPAAQSVVQSQVDLLDLPRGAVLEQRLTHVEALRGGTRALAVLDVSDGMDKDLGATATTRMTQATQALRIAGGAMPDDAELGLWAFAGGLGEDAADHQEVTGVSELGSADDEASHRTALYGAYAQLTQGVGTDRSALYSTVVDAYEHMTSTYATGAANRVVVLTAGRELDADGPDLDEALARIGEVADEGTPVPVRIVVLGAGGDLRALDDLAGATGGSAVRVTDADQLQDAVTDALSPW